MPYTCPLCSLEPLSHSLNKLSEKERIIYYYTCPSQAILYYDVKSIINHYEGVLSEIPENKEWVWIFDSKDFSFKHAMQITVATELAKLISHKLSKNLKKIIIINPTIYITLTHTLILPFLNEHVKNLIEINYENENPEELIL